MWQSSEKRPWSDEFPDFQTSDCRTTNLSLEEFDTQFRGFLLNGEAFERLAQWLAEDGFEFQSAFSDEPTPRDAMSLLVAESRATLLSGVTTFGDAHELIQSTRKQEWRSRLDSSRAHFGLPPVNGSPLLDDAATMLDPLLGHLRTHLPPILDTRDGDYEAQAGAVILHAAQNTIFAISVLVRNGYEMDAAARWRALHELAATAHQITTSADPSDCARRYLVHGEFLWAPEHLTDLESDLQSEAQKRHWTDVDYGWVNGGSPNSPSRVSQSSLFEQMGPTNELVKERWMKLSHGSVHLSSMAVALSSVDPYSPVDNWDGSLRAEFSAATLHSTNAVIASVLELCLISPNQRDPDMAYDWYCQLRAEIDILMTRLVSSS